MLKMRIRTVSLNVSKMIGKLLSWFPHWWMINIWLYHNLLSNELYIDAFLASWEELILFPSYEASLVEWTTL